MDLASKLPFVLYEDSHCFVLDKPSEMHSVAARAGVARSLAARLIEAEPGLAWVSEKEGDAGLVQRLDYETSGVILGAKDRAAWQYFRNLLQTGKIQKSYLILTEGKFPSELAMNNFIGGQYRRSKKVQVYTRKRERTLAAFTNFVSVEYWNSSDISLVRAFAPTARRHQVRAHAASAGHPLVGDTLYGSRRQLQEVLSSNRPDTLPQFFLQAESIQFTPPGAPDIVTVRAKRPDFLDKITIR